MLHFNPTVKVFETAGNVSDFVKNNKQVFWDIFNPLLPFIIGLVLVDFLVNVSFYATADSDNKFNLGSVIANYFYAALIISWHRVVIHGPESYVPVNPLKPKKGELIFMGMAIVISVTGMLLAALCGLILLALGPVGFFIGIMGGIILAIYLTYKVSFYFPARAADTPISLKESFFLTQGFFWKMCGAGLLASLKIVLIAIGYIILVAFLGAGVFGLVVSSGGTMLFLAHIYGFLVQLPILVYFQPVLSIIGVTVLSNYYLYAIQNRPAPAQ